MVHPQIDQVGILTTRNADNVVTPFDQLSDDFAAQKPPTPGHQYSHVVLTHSKSCCGGDDNTFAIETAKDSPDE